MAEQNQIIIDIGAEANDGTGDPLRSAFNDVNLNFANIYQQGPVNSNIRIANNTIATTDTNGNLILSPNGTGNVRVNGSLSPDIGGIRNLGEANLPWSDVYATTLDVGQVTIDELQASNAIIGGTLQANVVFSNTITVLSNSNINLSGNLLANGLVSTNLLAVAGNGVINNLSVSGSAYLGNAVSMDGNLTVPGVLTANGLTVLNTTFFSGNITGNGNLILSNGDIACQDILSSGNLSVNGDSLLFGNSNVGGFISAGGNIVTPATIIAGNIQANSITANIVGNINGNLTVTGTVAAGRVTAADMAASGNIQANLLIGNIALATGGYSNADAVAYGEQGWTGNIVPSGPELSLGNATRPWKSLFVSNSTIWLANVPINMYPGNVLHVNGQPVLQNASNTSIATTGNLTATNFIGNGAALTAITGGNVTGQVANALVAGTVYTPAQPAITSVGNLTDVTVVNTATVGNLATQGTIQANGNIQSNSVVSGNRISASANVSGETVNANTVIANSQLTVQGLSRTQDIIPSANLQYSLGNSSFWWTNLWVSGNTLYLGGVPLGITGSNTLTVDGQAVLSNSSNASITTTGDISAANFIATQNVSASGSITGNSVGSNTVSATGNVSGGNLTTGGRVDAIGNVSGGNLTTTGTVDAQGNISGGNINTAAGVYSNTVDANTIVATGNISADNLLVTTQILANAVFGQDTAVLGNGSGDIQIYAQSSGLGVQTFDVGANTYNTWFYDNEGNLNLPGGYVIGEPGAQFLKISAPGNSIGIQFDYDSNVLLDIGNAGSGNAFSVTVEGNSWTFDATGNLNLPGSGYISGSANRIEMYADTAETNGLLFDTNIAQVYGTQNLELFSDWAGTGNIWTFYANALLSTPGGITTAGAVDVGGNISAHGLTTTTATGITANGSNITINEITGAGGYLIATGANLSGNSTISNLNITGNVSQLTTDSDALIGGNLSVLGTDGITASKLLIDSVAGITANAGNVDINEITGQGGYLNATGAVFSNGVIATGNITADGLLVSTGLFPANLSASPAPNISGFDSVSAANLIAQLNLNSGNISANNSVTANGNITGANIVANVGVSTGTVTANGNIQGNNVISTNLVQGNSLSIFGDAVITGNIAVQGNVTYIDIEDLRIQDPLIQLGGGANGNALTTNDGRDRGTLLTYYVTDQGNAFVGWKNSSGNMLIASNVSVANELITVNSYGTVEAGTVYAQAGLFTGNVNANYFVGDGSQLTNLPIQPGTYSNSNVANYLPSYSGNLTSLTGNVTTTANISANYFIGNGSQLTGVVSSYTNSNVVSLLSAFGSNTITTTGNVTAGYLIGDGSQLTNLPTLDNYSNANVANYLPIYSGNLSNLGGNVITTANVSANYFIGDGSQLTNLPVQPGTYSNSNVANYLPTYSGNLVSLTGNVNTTGNISANYFLGNGSQLTGIVSSYGDSNVVSLLSGFGSNSISTTGNLSAGNIESTGTLISDTVQLNANGTVTFGDATVQTTAYQKVASSFNQANPVVILDNFKASIDNAGNPTVGGVTSNFNCIYTLENTLYNGSAWIANVIGANTTFVTAFGSGIGITFTTPGDKITGTFQDTSGNAVYQAIWIAGPGGANTGYGTIVVERLD